MLIFLLCIRLIFLFLTRAGKLLVWYILYMLRDDHERRQPAEQEDQEGKTKFQHCEKIKNLFTCFIINWKGSGKEYFSQTFFSNQMRKARLMACYISKAVLELLYLLFTFYFHVHLLFNYTAGVECFSVFRIFFADIGYPVPCTEGNNIQYMYRLRAGKCFHVQLFMFLT